MDYHTLLGVTFFDIDFGYGNFFCNFNNIRFIKSKLSQCNFKTSKIFKFDFSRANISADYFIDCQFNEINMEDHIL